jgi:chemotaxis protein histidine kinase CheA
MAEKIKYTVEIDDNGSGAKVDNLNSKIKDTGTTAANSQSKFGNLAKEMGNIKGPIGNAVQGIQGLGTAFKALMANPIGALIAVLVGVFGALRSALDKTEAGMDAIARITAIFGAIINPIINAISEFAVILVDGLASGLELVAGLFGTAASEGKKLANMQDELEDQELALNEARAKGNKELAQARELLSDSNATLAERKNALDQVRKSETDLAAKELEFAKSRLKAAQLDKKLNNETEASKKAISDAIVGVQNAETDLAAKRRLFNREAKKLDREEKEQKEAAKKAAEDEAKAAAERQKAYQERLKAAADKREDDFQKWLAIEVEKAETEASNAKFLEDRLAKEAAAEEAAFQAWLALEIEKTEIANSNAKFMADREEAERQARLDAEKAASDALIALKQAEADAQMELMQSISGAFKSLASIAGEQTAAGKVLALASTVIDTYMGATKALAAGAGTPVGYINAAAIIATGLANVRTITAVQIPNQSGGSTPSMPSISGPSVGIIQGQMSQTSQLQAEMNAQMKRPTRAYVVGQNVTTQQSLDRHILENATL